MDKALKFVTKICQNGNIYHIKYSKLEITNYLNTGD